MKNQHTVEFARREFPDGSIEFKAVVYTYTDKQLDQIDSALRRIVEVYPELRIHANAIGSILKS